MKPRIYADFNNSTEDYKVRLNSVGSKADTNSASVPLIEGAKVVLYDEELEVEGGWKLQTTGATGSRFRIGLRDERSSNIQQPLA